MTGEAIMTHQIPRALNEVRECMTEKFPELSTVEVPQNMSSDGEVAKFLAGVVSEFGDTRYVEPAPVGTCAPMDPFIELVAIRGLDAR